MTKIIFKNKITKIFLISVISLNLLGLFTFILIPFSVSAADAQSSENYCRDLTDPEGPEGKERYIKLGVPIPGFTQERTVDGKKIYVVKDLSCYIYYFYKYFASVVGILAAVMIIYGGFRYLTSFGNPTRIAAAKEQITSAVIGLFLTLGTYIILFTINPSIVTMRNLSITSIMPIQQRGMWCDEKWGDVPVSGGSKQCGQEGVTKEKTKCTWGGGCTKDELCGLTGGDRLPYVCQNYKELCKATEAGYCKGIDDAMAAANIIHEICRPPSTIGKAVSANCYIVNASYCIEKWKRVDCNVGGALETPCWKDGKPRYPGFFTHPMSSYTVKTTCVNESEQSRVVEGDRAVCCGKWLKGDIDCRAASYNNGRGCNDDEVPVDCGQFNSTKSENYDGGGTDDGACVSNPKECYCNKVCCMELGLTAESLK